MPVPPADYPKGMGEILRGLAIISEGIRSLPGYVEGVPVAELTLRDDVYGLVASHALAYCVNEATIDTSMNREILLAGTKIKPYDSSRYRRKVTHYSMTEFEDIWGRDRVPKVGGWFDGRLVVEVFIDNGTYIYITTLEEEPRRLGEENVAYNGGPISRNRTTARARLNSVEDANVASPPVAERTWVRHTNYDLAPAPAEASIDPPRTVDDVVTTSFRMYEEAIEAARGYAIGVGAGGGQGGIAVGGVGTSIAASAEAPAAADPHSQQADQGEY